MEYWELVMNDDVFLVMNDGWLKAAKPRPAIDDKTASSLRHRTS